MVNVNLELWIHVAAIIAAFIGAAFGAWLSHYLEMQRKQKEEEKEVEDFKEVTLRRLKLYASILSEEKIVKYEDLLEKLLVSLRFGDASTLYYKIPKEERKEIDPVLDLLFSEQYGEAIGELESLIAQ